MTQQIVRSPSTGLTRRTFRGKIWGVVVQRDEASPAALLIFPTETKAREICDYIGRDMAPEVHYVERLDVVA